MFQISGPTAIIQSSSNSGFRQSLRLGSAGAIAALMAVTALSFGDLPSTAAAASGHVPAAACDPSGKVTSPEAGLGPAFSGRVMIDEGFGGPYVFALPAPIQDPLPEPAVFRTEMIDEGDGEPYLYTFSFGPIDRSVGGSSGRTLSVYENVLQSAVDVEGSGSAFAGFGRRSVRVHEGDGVYSIIDLFSPAGPATVSPFAARKVWVDEGDGSRSFVDLGVAFGLPSCG